MTDYLIQAIHVYVLLIAAITNQFGTFNSIHNSIPFIGIH